MEWGVWPRAGVSGEVDCRMGWGRPGVWGEAGTLGWAWNWCMLGV
jgi:hypothetical protein